MKGVNYFNFFTLENDVSSQLDTLTIQGFKSIRDLKDFKLKNLNILVGGNGAGKSNFIDFFRLLSAIMEGTFNKFIRARGGIGDFLFNGRKITEKMSFKTYFGLRGYRFSIEPSVSADCLLTNEARYYERGTSGWWELGNSHDGTSLLAQEALSSTRNSEYSKYVYSSVTSWKIYHFHDTSATANMKHYEIIQDTGYLRYDAANIAPFLLHLRSNFPSEYTEIVNAIRLAIPFFDDFILQPTRFGEAEKVNISWRQKGSDYPMQPYHFSDGSLRFICLATALLQPNPPSTIIIDEPELGLHPAALGLLAELIQSASERTQLIVATQSPTLIDYFSIEDIIVVNRKDGASTFERLNEEDFTHWLEEYSVGELWTKNVIAGGPRHE